jgi:hypothetical protein
MDIENLERNADKVHAALKEEGNQLIALKDCKVYVPEHYIGSFLGSMEGKPNVVGIFGIVVEDKYYAVSRCCAIVALDPSITNIIEIDGMNYMEFLCQKGDVVIENLNVIKISTLAYRIFAEICEKGKVPWYLDYDDLTLLFDTALEHANFNIGSDAAIMEMINSSLGRDPSDKTKFYRHMNKKGAKSKASFVGLNSIAYGATNTTAKLLGAYFQEGMTSSLITKSERTESIEEILRK